MTIFGTTYILGVEKIQPEVEVAVLEPATSIEEPADTLQIHPH